MKRLLVVSGLVGVALGCGDPEQLGTSRAPDSMVAVPPARVDSGTFTIDEFRGLAWLHGRWRGFMPDGRTFFEEYEFVDDSTILMRAFVDSSFTTPSDSARITLRGGTVASQGPGARWVATRLDATGADFAPQRGAGNAFTWSREDSTKWNAVIRWTDPEGRTRSRLYALHRYGR